MGALAPTISKWDFSRWVGLSPDRYQDPATACWSFACDVLREEQGIVLPAFDIRDEPDTEGLLHVHRGLLGWACVPLETAQPYDAIMFRVLPHRVHVGLVVSRGKFLHMSRDHESRIERYTGFSWQHRIEGVYRYAP